MTHVHYKFSSKRSYNTVVFDGVNITLSELKRLIMTREKLKATDCDLEITNGQTKEEYTENDCPIPTGSSVIVRRVPSRAGKSSSSSNSSGRSETCNYNSGFFKPPLDGQKSTGVLPIFSQMTDLATAEVSEDFKIKTIMNQSCYDSSNYQKYATPLPANYTCYRCGSNEHHIRSCPMGMDKNADTAVRIKKSTGIPRSFMVKVDDPTIKGAMLTNTGDYAIPAIDAEAYAVAKKKLPIQEQQCEVSTGPPIPDELLCLICQELLNDAVVIPCCGNSYCDDCIRSALLDSEDHVCPNCSQSDVSPDTLIANKFLRQAVNNFTKEQCSTQSFKSTPSTSQSKDCTPRPSPAPTPPPQSQSDKSQVTDIVIHSDSPPISSSSTLNVASIFDETPEKETDMKINSSPTKSPSPLVLEAVDCLMQPTTLVDSVKKAEPEKSDSGSTAQCDQAAHCERSTSEGVSEGWTGISAQSSASSTATISLPQYPQVSPSLIQPYLPQQPLCNYPPAFSITAPPWTSGHSPQGAPLPAFSSSPTPTISPLLPKGLMMYHRSQERTPPRESSYEGSCHYSSRTYKSKGFHSTSRSRSRSRDNTRHHSSYSNHRGQSSRSHSSHSYSHRYRRSHSPISTPSSSHSQLRSRSPGDGHKSRHHSHHRNSSSRGRSSRQRKEGEASEHNYDTYLRWKKEYTDWYEKYFHSYFSHFHQMPPPPPMPPPQPHWPSKPSYHQWGQSPPTCDSRSSQSQSSSDRSSSTTHSSSSYSDSTPTQSFSDSNSPLSDDCTGASNQSGRVDKKQNKMKESVKRKTDNRYHPKSPQQKIRKHKSKDDDKKVEDLKLLDKDKDRKLNEEKNRHKTKTSKKTVSTDADRSRHLGPAKSPTLRSDKKEGNRDEETLRNQRQIIPAESPSCSDLFPKMLEREKLKKAVWKPQPLTKENAWEDGVKVKLQKKININIKLDSKKNETNEQDSKETNKTTEAKGQTVLNQFYSQVDVSKTEESVDRVDVKNDSWEIFPDDEPVVGEDLDLWQCALTATKTEEEGLEVEKRVDVPEQDAKPQEKEDRNCERPSQTDIFPTSRGSVTVFKEQQKTVEKTFQENMEQRSWQKRTDNIKITHSRQDREAFDCKTHAKVSSHHREVKVKTKRRYVEAENAEDTQGDDSVKFEGTMAPSTGQSITDSSFFSDRKEKKKSMRDSESRTADEGRRHKERESDSTLYKKSLNGSCQKFTAILDPATYKNHWEAEKVKGREVKSRKIKMEVDVEWKGKDAYSKYKYHDDVCLSWTPHSLPSQTTSEENHHTGTSREHVPHSAESSKGTALDPGERSERRERKFKSKDKRKSHKKEKMHPSPDEKGEIHGEK